MNDQELDLALHHLGELHVRRKAPLDLRQSLRAVPVETPLRTSWMPRIHQGGSTMFSALKFVAAGVIVALFGGFLLTGVLTTRQGDDVLPAAVTESPAPMTTEELLSGMVTEEVAPGVFRVDHDGVRDLMEAYAVNVGSDGSVWGARDDGIFRLGGEFVEWPTESPEAIRIAPDGTVWAGLRSYDGHRWTEHEVPPGATDDDYIRVSHLDGTTWTTWPDPQGSGRWTVARLDGGQWLALDPPFVPVVPLGRVVAWVDLQTTDHGDIWAETAFEYSRWTDGEWQRVFVGGDSADRTAFDSLLGLAPDGSIWVLRMEFPVFEGPDDGGPRYHETLRFFDGTKWLEWGDDAWAPFGSGELDVIGVGPDGSLWSTSGRGVLRFDGERWGHYLADLHVEGGSDIGPDGSVWVLAGAEPLGEVEGLGDNDKWYDLYVITSEAVAE